MGLIGGPLNANIEAAAGNFYQGAVLVYGCKAESARYDLRNGIGAGNGYRTTFAGCGAVKSSRVHG